MFALNDSKLYVARHGQNFDNANGILNGHRDLPLTELGEKQARELARDMLAAKISVQQVYCSPLVRAIHTANIVAEHYRLGVPEILSGLIERDFGALTGVLQSEILKMVPEDDLIITPTIKYFKQYGNAESFDALLERARLVLEQVEHLREGKDTVLVCHGDIGKMLAAAYYQRPWRDVLVGFHFGNSDLIELSPSLSLETAKVISIKQFNT